MPIRLRKFIGVFATVFYLITYALLAMAIGGQYVVGSGFLFEFAYYVVGGFAWVPGAMMIIRWMSRG